MKEEMKTTLALLIAIPVIILAAVLFIPRLAWHYAGDAVEMFCTYIAEDLKRLK